MQKDFSQEKSFVFFARMIHFKNSDCANNCKNDWLLVLTEKVCLFGWNMETSVLKNCAVSTVNCFLYYNILEDIFTVECSLYFVLECLSRSRVQLYFYHYAFSSTMFTCYVKCFAVQNIFTHTRQWALELYFGETLHIVP